MEENSARVKPDDSHYSEALAGLIRKEKGTILSVWDERLRNELRASESKDQIILRDSLPALLDRIAEIIDGKETIRGRTIQAVGQAHGEQRAEMGDYSLEEVLIEYSVLRKVLFEILEKDQPISNRERELILATLETSIRMAVTEFVRIQYERLRAKQSHVEFLIKEGESREQFVSLVTHDLKNPLTSARLSAELLIRQPIDASLCRMLSNRILESIVRAETMIKDLLDISRVRAGRPLLVSFEYFNLDEVIGNVVQDFSLLYGNRFVLNGPTKIYGNWGKEALRRAVENLLSNAVKYGDDRRTVSVIFGCDQKDVWISVHNWGNPIPPSDVLSLFRPYQRILNQVNKERKGWGLGLAQVKAVADAHQGCVTVESSLQQGTLFTLRFPKTRLIPQDPLAA